MRMARCGTFLLIAMLLGCGSSPTTQPTAAVPHGGLIVNLPDGKGFVEIVTKPLKKGEKSQSEFQVYFLGPDRAAPLAPAPTTARLTVVTPGGEKTIELKPQEGAFVSPPAETLLSGHDLSGYLNVDFGAGPVKVEISGR